MHMHAQARVSTSKTRMLSFKGKVPVSLHLQPTSERIERWNVFATWEAERHAASFYLHTLQSPQPTPPVLVFFFICFFFLIFGLFIVYLISLHDLIFGGSSFFSERVLGTGVT